MHPEKTIKVERGPDRFENNLLEQYRTQIVMLERVGLLRNAEMVDLNGTRHRAPDTKQILERIRTSRHLLEEKARQGFTKLLIVPIGTPLKDFISVYTSQVALRRRNGTLVDTSGIKIEGPADDLKDVWVYNAFERADENGLLLYYPRQFSQTPHIDGAVEKKKLQPFCILMVRDAANTPRKDLRTPCELLSQTASLSHNRGESGYTPEIAIVDALTRLHEKNMVTDDKSASWLLGSYLSAGRFVPIMGWNRDQKRGIIGAQEPATRDTGIGARTAVCF
jgi:hypothetical protein